MAKGRMRRVGHWKGKKFSPKHKKAISRAIKAWWASGRRKKGGKKATKTRVNRSSSRKTSAKRYKDKRRNKSAARARSARTNSKIGWRTLKKELRSRPKSSFRDRLAASGKGRKATKVNRMKKR